MQPSPLLRYRVPLFCSLEIPPDGLGVVHRNAQTMVVHMTKVGLRERETSIRGLAKPLGGCFVVLENAVTAEVHPPEVALCGCVTLFCGPAIPTQCFTGVLGNTQPF